MPSPQADKPLWILLVEDSEHDMLAFKRAISKSDQNFQLVHYYRAESALEGLQQPNLPHIDLIVSDYKLPGMTGLALFKTLRSNRIELPFIMLTGSGNEELAVEALKAGVDDYLVKDPQSKYLELLPLVLKKVLSKFEDRTARKVAEEEIKESAARYRAMVESIDGFVYVCSQDYRIEFMNERLIKRSGRDGTGEVCYKVLHNLDSICPWCINERVFAGEKVQWEGKSPKDGRWMHVVNTPLHHIDGSISKQSIFFDITERKEMEDALRDSEKRLSDILNLLPDATFAIDLEGKVTLWNKAAEDYTGVKAADILGKGNYAYAVPIYGEQRPLLIDMVLDPQKQVAELYPHFKKETDRISGECFMRSPTHGEIYMMGSAALLYDSKGNITGAIESIRDITSRKQMELTLQKSEERFRAMAETSPLAIYLSDGPLHKLEYINPRFSELFGYSQEEVSDLSQWWQQAYPYEEYREQVFREWTQRTEEAIRTKSSITPLETTVTCKDGSAKHILWGFTALGRQNITFGMDLTERKHAEEALLRARDELERRVAERTEELALTVNMLQEAVTMLQDEVAIRKKSEQELLRSQERLQMAQHAARIGTFEWDILNKKTLWKHGLEDIYGDAVLQLNEHGSNWKDYVHPEDVNPMLQTISTAINNNGDIQHEYRIILPDSTIHWLEMWAKIIYDDNGQASRIIGINMDITARKQAEADLRSYSEELYDLYNHAPCGYHSLDSEGYFVRINDTELKWLGYNREEIIGKLKFSDLLTEKGKLIFDGTFPNLKKNGQVRDVEQEMIRKDGSIIPVILSATVLYDSNGNYLMSRSTLFDISELKQTEEKLRQNDLMLMQQSRFAAMGEMIGNIAHQWRQPLNTLGLLIQQLPCFYGSEEFNLKFIEENSRECMSLIDHMSQTIDDFRNFFKPDKEKVNFDANRIISRTIAMIDASFVSHQITVSVNSEGITQIFGYPNEFSQVIMTILNNARDAFTERNIKKGHINVCTTSQCERVTVTITDTAGGIPEEIIDRIFDPYFTTKGPNKGTGIGLYMAKTIIEKNMGGSLSVSNTGSGARFTIEI